METPKEYYYTYYSYEEYGRGYIGSRGCKCPPEQDIRYFGSFKDKIFNPTQKIILKSDYATREEAYVDEIILQKYYNVVENPHFANRSYQTSTGFTTSGMKITEEFRQKMSEVTKGKNNGMYGKKRPDLVEMNKKRRGKRVILSSKTLIKKKTVVKNVNSQRWKCCETGYVSTAAGVVSYQKGKKLDTSKNNRKKIS